MEDKQITKRNTYTHLQRKGKLKSQNRERQETEDKITIIIHFKRYGETKPGGKSEELKTKGLQE